MKLTEMSRHAQEISELLENIRLDHANLAYFIEVFNDYSTGKKLPNEHMNANLALRQLIDAAYRALKTTGTL